ncbi:NADH-quinone oxidoreductase subunit N [Aliiglaciecola sp. CAU 1673]|uniref:NADH-quinone oxidoreductase subunit N n=1 Tax=Aliiglaciecola sp. CAU 1673 TaxID=3032595 RepID=UPI0023DB6FDB|nr:NADH-quinone oxidoreductase subunit N [Aliiglaciecola sp. CAU 1673]MDF2176659.1 NADH-quinone oxidoreductase subunit N [Aliiglaciecola sp. CAU 1673]
MNRIELISLLPVLVLASGIMVLMLQTASRRSEHLSRWICLLTLILSLAAQLWHYPDAAQPITRLLAFEPVGAFFGILVLVAGVSVTLIQGPYAAKQREPAEEFYLLLLCSCLGALLLTLASHVGTVILSLELMSLPFLAMMAYNRQRTDALEAAFKYLILSGAASSLLLMGFALLYVTGGTLELAHILPEQPGLLARAGLVLVMAALAFKLSLVPLHIWTADVYQGANLSATLLLTSVSKAAAFALLIKLMLATPPVFARDLYLMLSLMAIASMLLGNWLALLQNSIKRLMAYSAIAHMGYALVAAIVATQSGHRLVVEGAAYYLLAYLIASILIFGILALLSDLGADADKDDIHDVKGLFWQHPWLAVGLSLAFLSLAGMPITVGFIGKFYLLTLAVKSELWWLIAAMLLGSAVGLYYYLRVIFSLYAEGKKGETAVTGNHTSRGWLGLMAAVLLLLGILPGLLGDRLGLLLLSS